LITARGLDPMVSTSFKRWNKEQSFTEEALITQPGKALYTAESPTLGQVIRVCAVGDTIKLV
jgi:hypothetical protein